MPALSSTMTEGKVVQWLKAEGDKVSKGEPIVVVESDKADMDVESFEEGILGAIVVEEGEITNVGSPIAYIAETDAEVAEAKAKAGGGSAPAVSKSAESSEEEKGLPEVR
jgi:pyruvate dehydrogenase E2 component (dihydrolipoamide acetyltransferase)